MKPKEGYSLSCFDYLLLEPFVLKNPLRIFEIMEYVNNISFYRRLGVHKPHVDKSRFKGLSIGSGNLSQQNDRNQQETDFKYFI